MHHIPARFARPTLAAVLALLAAQPAYPGTIAINFQASNFSNPLDIDNPYFPLVVGTTQVFRGESKKDGCEVSRVQVTNQTKVVAGIQTRVVRDVVYEDEECEGELTKVEDTLDFYAQDNAGNVWYMGEVSRDCKDGKCTLSEGSWEAGKDVFNTGTKARAGIIMLANPRHGDRYHQEIYPGHAVDEALVTGVGIKVTLQRPDAIQPKTFANCLKIKEWTKLEPGHIGFKYYCLGFGLVAEDEHHGGLFRAERVQ